MVSSWWRFLVGIEIPPPPSQPCKGRSNPCTDEGRQHERGGLGAVLETCRSATAEGQVFVVRAEGAGVGPRSRPVCRRRPRGLLGRPGRRTCRPRGQPPPNSGAALI